jgi:hypothetical protein
MTDIDEDSLDRSPDSVTVTESEGAPIPEFPEKLGKPATTRTVASPEVIEQLSRIASGKKIPTCGPTGKPTGGKYPTVAEQLKAADILAKLSFVLPEKTEAPPPVEVEPPDPEELRTAVLGDLLSKVPVEPPKLVVDPSTPGSTVVSITDPDAIADFDAALANPMPKDSADTVHLGEGYIAYRDIQAGTGKVIWRCFNERNEHCANKSSPEACRDWFANSTAAGLALKERGQHDRARRSRHRYRRCPQSADRIYR